MSLVEAIIQSEARESGWSQPVQEYTFNPPRRWRFDFCWPNERVALEIEGGVWSGGRHTRGQGFVNDLEKYNWAAFLGWKLIRLTPEDVKAGKVGAWLKRIKPAAGPVKPAPAPGSLAILGLRMQSTTWDAGG